MVLLLLSCASDDVRASEASAQPSVVPAVEAAPAVVTSTDTVDASPVASTTSTPALPGAATCPAAIPTPWNIDPRATSGTVLVVYKEAFAMGLYQDGTLVADPFPLCAPIAMGRTPQGPKTRLDRTSTPEGWYKVSSRRDVGQTAWYRGFLLNYPNLDDIDRAVAAGVISTTTANPLRDAARAGRLPSQGTAMGGDILIHGNGSAPRNWTWGCVATDNAWIDLFFPRVKAGDDVLIVPWPAAAG